MQGPYVYTYIGSACIYLVYRVQCNAVVANTLVNAIVFVATAVDFKETITRSLVYTLDLMRNKLWKLMTYPHMCVWLLWDSFQKN